MKQATAFTSLIGLLSLLLATVVDAGLRGTYDSSISELRRTKRGQNKSKEIAEKVEGKSDDQKKVKKVSSNTSDQKNYKVIVVEDKPDQTKEKEVGGNTPDETSEKVIIVEDKLDQKTEKEASSNEKNEEATIVEDQPDEKKAEEVVNSVSFEKPKEENTVEGVQEVSSTMSHEQVDEISMIPIDKEQETQTTDSSNATGEDQTSVTVEDQCEIGSGSISSYIKGDSWPPEEKFCLNNSDCASCCCFNHYGAHYFCVAKADSTMLRGCTGAPRS